MPLLTVLKFASLGALLASDTLGARAWNLSFLVTLVVAGYAAGPSGLVRDCAAGGVYRVVCHPAGECAVATRHSL